MTGSPTPAERMPQPNTPTTAGLGVFPLEFDVPALGERRATAAARAFAVIALISMMVNVAEAGLAVAFTPLQGDQPIVIGYDKDRLAAEELVSAARRVDGGAALVEHLAAGYVGMREALPQDRSVIAEIYAETGALRAQTPNATAWAELLQREQARVVAANAENYSEAVEIVEVSALVAGRVYQVDFDVSRRNSAGQVTSVKPLRAVLEIEFAREAREGAFQFSNPMGFRVMAYSLAARRLA